jgi:hypothetical protein
MTPYTFAAFVSAEKPLTPENVRPGGLAFLVVMLLCVATFLLARSFLKHAKKAQQPWDGDDSTRTTPHDGA